MKNIELRCSRDLALRLGAIIPETIDHHRQMRDAGHMLVRDIITSWPLFWPLVDTHKYISITRSSD